QQALPGRNDARLSSLAATGDVFRDRRGSHPPSHRVARVHSQQEELGIRFQARLVRNRRGRLSENRARYARRVHARRVDMRKEQSPWVLSARGPRWASCGWCCCINQETNIGERFRGTKTPCSSTTSSTSKRHARSTRSSRRP